MIRAAGIICKPIPEMVTAVVPELRRWLEARKVEVSVDPRTRTTLDPSGPAMTREEMAAKVDLLIVLGGDGTLLAAARALGGHDVPILAVNLGGLGFLTSVTLDELYPVLEAILAGANRTSERRMLEAEIVHSNKPAERLTALNDAVANKAALARMLDFDVHVDHHHVGRYRADGLIVATPHMLTNRPLVVPDTAHVELDFSASGEPVYLTLDGQIGFQLQPQDRVVITKAATKVQVVNPPRKTYYEILRSKLRWGER